jgi:hypothetical protein
MHAAGWAIFPADPDDLRPGVHLAAATFILKQTEYKRLLAYSSIENMGIIAFGTGVGGLGAYGAVICLIHHSLIKSSLFLIFRQHFAGLRQPVDRRHRGAGAAMPKTFVAFFGGFAGISGFPPFGIFIGEFFIIIGRISHRALPRRRAFHPEPLRHLRRLCQPCHENFFRRFRCPQFEQKANHGLAPVRTAADIPGALLLDAGTPVSDHQFKRSISWAEGFNATDFIEIGNGRRLNGTHSAFGF